MLLKSDSFPTQSSNVKRLTKDPVDRLPAVFISTGILQWLAACQVLEFPRLVPNIFRLSADKIDAFTSLSFISTHNLKHIN